MARAGRAAVFGLVAVLVAAAVGVAMYLGVGPIIDRNSCRVEIDGTVVELKTDQAENAALIAAIAERRGLPARAVSIALATAYQESKIRNIEHGDRDSLGLFQQRPSQGWGTEEQILDPYYATNAFYDALVEVEGYETMRITEAAQEVQRSGFPEAYADHATDARLLASALTGNSPAAFSCVVDEPEEGSTRLNRAGLTPTAAAVRRDIERAFGDQALGGFQPGGVRTGHMEGSAHYEGRAIDVFFRPINAENRRQGWAVASYLVARADLLGIDHVIFDDRIWSAGRSDSGWRDYDVDTSDRDPATAAVLEHKDHVHVDVA